MMANTTPSMGIPYRETGDLATVAQDNEAAYRVIDARLSELQTRLTAREKIFVTHDGDGSWEVQTGLGEPVPVTAGADGNWQVVA